MNPFDNLKSIAKILQEAGKIEQYQQILETQEKLLEMQKRIKDLEEENKSLKEKLKIKGNIIIENNTYWIKKDGGEKDGPFCTRCWDKNNELIRLPIGHGKPTHLKCPECKNLVQIRPFEPYRPRNINPYSRPPYA